MLDTAIALVLVCLSIAWIALNARTTGDLFSPLNLLLFFWILPFGLGLTKLSDLQTGLLPDAIAICVAATLVMVLISSAAALLVERRTLQSSLETFKTSNFNSPQGLLVASLLMIGATSIVYYVEFREGWPFVEYLLQSAAESDLHRRGKDSRLQVIGHGIFVSGMLFFYAGLTAKSRWLRAACLVVSLVPLAYGVAKASKSDIFLPALSYAALYYYYRRSIGQRVPFGFMLPMVAVLGGGMMLLSTLRLWGIESTASLTYGEVIGFRYNNLLPFLINELAATIYGYSALNFQNFSNFVGAHPDNSLHLGTSMFRPLLSFLMQGDIADSMIPSRSEWHYVSEAATVGTFLRELYMEGGALLCILGSAIYALLVNVIYVQFRRRRSVTWLFVYIVFLFPWTWLFFQNAFSVLQFYIDAFYVLAISLASALLRVVISSKRGIAAGTHRY